ncbi:MAG: alpha-L-arabinofuranosidase [Ginsengibacter sp.]
MKTIITIKILLAAIILLACCKKSKTVDNAPGTGTIPVVDSVPVVIVPPVEQPLANTVGFFLNDWTPKTFTAPSYIDGVLSSSAAAVTVTIDHADIIAKVPNSIFGQNANVWMTQIVTESSLINNITNLHPGVIRFPGGSLSDVFFWNANPGSPPSDAPATLPDANGTESPAGYWYGKNSQSWTMSVDNYYNMLQQTGNQGMITVNYGYARYSTAANPVASAAHLAADWVRYDNGRTKYWEIGNEDNGTWEAGYRINTANNHDAQPQIITGNLYGPHVKVFADSMKKAAQQIGKTIYIGAQLLEAQPQSWQTPTDQTWNSGVLSQVGDAADFYIIHSYFTPYQQNSSADIILNTAINNPANMMSYLKNSFNSAGATLKPIALTEWNITSKGSKQQVSFINGMHAAILLGETLKNKYGETSRWDFANGWSDGDDHGLFNIGDEPGVSKWNPRPAFYYMYYFQKTIGDKLLNTAISGSTDILAYGSSFTSGENGVILVNKGTSSTIAQVIFKNAAAGKRVYWYTLTGGTDNGEFSGKVYVNGNAPSEATGGPAGYAGLKAYSASVTNNIKIELPSRSVVYMVVDK